MIDKANCRVELRCKDSSRFHASDWECPPSSFINGAEDVADLALYHALVGLYDGYSILAVKDCAAGDKFDRGGSVVCQRKSLSSLFHKNNYKGSTRRNINGRKDFMLRRTRMNFIRKVYSIFTTQILATLFVTIFIMNSPRLAHSMLNTFKPIFFIGTFIQFASSWCLHEFDGLRHTEPWNNILLAIYTIAQSLVLGTFASFLGPKRVCLGLMYTLTAFAAITIYSFQPNPRIELTSWEQVLLAALSCLVFGVPWAAYHGLHINDNITYCLLAIVFAALLVHDTQLIVGNKNHKKRFPPNEHILAALNIYQDVIGFVVQIFNLLAENMRDDEGKKKR